MISTNNKYEFRKLTDKEIIIEYDYMAQDTILELLSTMELLEEWLVSTW